MHRAAILYIQVKLGFTNSDCMELHIRSDCMEPRSTVQHPLSILTIPFLQNNNQQMKICPLKLKTLLINTPNTS